MALISAAVILLGISLVVHLWPSGDQAPPSPALTAAALAALQAGPDSDRLLLGELRRQAGSEPGDWRKLSEGARTLYATLWVEEVQRTWTWPAMTTVEQVENGSPTLSDAAAAYESLGQPEAAAAMRQLAQRFAQDHAAYQAWMDGKKHGATTPQPSMQVLEDSAKTAFAQLKEISARRLDFARSHANDLNLR